MVNWTTKPAVLRRKCNILCFRNAVYWLKATVYDWGHVEMTINCWSLLRVRGILGSWETESFRTESFAMGQNDGLRHLYICNCAFNFFYFFIKIVFPWHHQLLNNANQRKKMRACFSLCTTWRKHKLPSDILRTDVFWNIANTCIMTHYNK